MNAFEHVRRGLRPQANDADNALADIETDCNDLLSIARAAYQCFPERSPAQLDRLRAQLQIVFSKPNGLEEEITKTR
jgi:hypothetical protein